jgi:hypothetical protein
VTYVGILICFRSGEKEHIVTVLEDSLHEKPLKRRQVFNLPGDLKMLKSDGVSIYK